MTDPEQVRPSQLRRARSALRRGYSLKEAAQRAGVSAKALDRALWTWILVRLPDVEGDDEWI